MNTRGPDRSRLVTSTGGGHMALARVPMQGEAGRPRVRALDPQPSDAPAQVVMFRGQALPATELVDAYEKALRELRALRGEITAMRRKQRAKSKLHPFQVELLKLQSHLEEHDTRMIVMFEGRDGAGKGGAIRNVTRYMNEKHYRVVALGRPTHEQQSQWYFQRYVEQFPRGGEIVLFDRSWYNRAMVERVFNFCSDEEYENFMRGVTGFEKDLIRQGTVLVKLYFSVSKEEQARRFARRRHDPLRQWKLSQVDTQAQYHWDEFTDRKYEMLRRTSTQTSPWVIIRSGDKYRARLNAIKIILNAVDYADRNPDLDFVPDPDVVVSGPQELFLMEAERIRNGRFSS
jgi:polyphosphate kinase